MEVLVAVLAVVGMLGASVVAALAVRRKVDAEGTQILADTAISLVVPLTGKIADLEARVCALEDESSHWFGVAQHGRVDHVERFGSDPPWWREFGEGGK